MTELSFNTMNHSAYLGTDARLPEQVQAAAVAGYTLFGPDLFSVLQLEAQGTPVEELAAMIERAGMRCFEIAALAIYDDRDMTLQGARELARIAGILRPEWVMANGFADLGAPATAALVDECVAMLAPTGAGLGWEFLPFTPMCSIAATLEFVRRTRDAGARAGVIVDTWHVFRGPDGLDGLAQLPLDDIAYVQFDDALPAVGEDPMEETLHRRAMPGSGEFPLAEFCARVTACGYQGPVSVEVLNADWRDRPIAGFVTATYEAARRFWPA
ncbi:MAG TPA: sugar phosphate isomerase/epimerase [Acidimicrobiales bacterium]|nr:sugar phosphate isomerase/epimerase [Acidimicrobiales bacterium]